MCATGKKGAVRARIRMPVMIKIIRSIRLPRTLAAVVIGGSLAVSGLTYQSIFRNRLASQDIFARKYFYPLTNDCAAYGFGGADTPIAKHISERVLCLPLYPELGLEDADRICEILCD